MIILLIPSWCALWSVTDVLFISADKTNMTFNANKTVYGF